MILNDDQSVYVSSTGKNIQTLILNCITKYVYAFCAKYDIFFTFHVQLNITLLTFHIIANCIEKCQL